MCTPLTTAQGHLQLPKPILQLHKPVLKLQLHKPILTRRGAQFRFTKLSNTHNYKIYIRILYYIYEGISDENEGAQTTDSDKVFQSDIAFGTKDK